MWWDTGAPPDFTTGDKAQTHTFTYLRAGNYTATLRVVDNGNPAQTNMKTVAITVAPAANVVPGAASGGPYVVDVGAALQLAGTATDSNLACGDTITTTWDLNNAGTFAAAQGATGIIPAATLAALPTGQPIPLKMRVVDAAGLATLDTTTVTIGTRPIRSPSGPPTRTRRPASSRSPSTGARASRRIRSARSRSISGTWTGSPASRVGGPTRSFVYAYPAFGALPNRTWPVTLQVTDDLGRTSSTTFNVTVNQGNLAPRPASPRRTTPLTRTPPSGGRAHLL